MHAVKIVYIDIDALAASHGQIMPHMIIIIELITLATCTHSN